MDILRIDDATDLPEPPHGESKGLIPRDFKSHPQGYMMAAPAAGDRVFDLPLADDQTIEAAIKRQAEEQSSPEHVFHRLGMKALDQNGQGYCHAADTEVLTDNGFIPFPEYNWTDPIGTVNPLTHAMEFQRPFERHVYEYDGPMIYSTNRRIDFGVTPDHQMYVRKWDERRRTLSDQYSFVRAGDIGWYAGLLPAPSGQIGSDLVEVEIPGDRRYDGDDLIALLGLIVSDGYAGGTANTQNWVSFASFRDETRATVAALAARVGFHEIPSRRGVWIRYDAGALAAWVRENCYTATTGAKNKRIPDLIKVASIRQIKHFLHWFDDRNRDGTQFYSVSKELIDDLQELFLRIGERSSIGQRPAKEVVAACIKGVIRSSECYVLTVGKVDQLCLDRKKHIETDRYKGLVYCAAVPNHTLITRRNGSVLISSNCWAYSTTSGIMMARAIAGFGYERLSGHMIGCIIKGYRDQGGWNAQSVSFAFENGVAHVGPASEGGWPEKSMSRSNDTPLMRQKAKTRAIVEAMDLDDGGERLRRQMATCLINGIVIATDYNWWSHSVLAARLMKWGPNGRDFTTKILNSWAEWSDRGWGELTGGRANPNGAIAIRAVRPAA